MSAIRISQVVVFSRTLSVHLNPQIEGTEIVCPQFSGGRFCQVVARTGSTVFQPASVAGRISFTNRAPLLWNILPRPREVQTSSSMSVFKKKVFFTP